MNGFIEIPTSAEEIVDRVDDMLAWLAIASQADLGAYRVNHFRRALPSIDLGNGECGQLMPSSVIVPEDPIDLEKTVTECGDIAQALPGWLRRTKRVSFARLSEVATGEDVPVLFQFPVTEHGDNVADSQYAEEYDGAPTFRGATYQLVSIGDEPALSNRHATRFRMPQTARMLHVQNVVIFRDGRATCHQTYFAEWGGKFYDMARRPLGLAIQGGGTFSPELFELAHAAIDAMARETNWVVELSLAKERTGIGLHTDALGAREFVNMLRATDTHKGRRKTLVHWVNEHMRRKQRLDPEATIKVAAHLRGMAGLDAGRYYARIWPATLDLERAKNGKRFDLSDDLLQDKAL